jgi:hypothetical protein
MSLRRTCPTVDSRTHLVPFRAGSKTRSFPIHQPGSCSSTLAMAGVDEHQQQQNRGQEGGGSGGDDGSNNNNSGSGSGSGPVRRRRRRLRRPRIVRAPPSPVRLPDEDAEEDGALERVERTPTR